MTDRKPDFWVIKSNSADMGYFERPGVWTRNKKTRARFSTEGEAIAVAYTGRVVPVFCTSKRAEPKMRERSSSWVLKRLVEGKVLVCKTIGGVGGGGYAYRFNLHTGHAQMHLYGKWMNCAAMPDVVDGKVLCRIARPSEVPQ